MVDLTTDEFDVVNYGAFSAGQRWARLGLPAHENPYANERLRRAWAAGFANPEKELGK